MVSKRADNDSSNQVTCNLKMIIRMQRATPSSHAHSNQDSGMNHGGADQNNTSPQQNSNDYYIKEEEINNSNGNSNHNDDSNYNITTTSNHINNGNTSNNGLLSDEVVMERADTHTFTVTTTTTATTISTPSSTTTSSSTTATTTPITTDITATTPTETTTSPSRFTKLKQVLKYLRSRLQDVSGSSEILKEDLWLSFLQDCGFLTKKQHDKIYDLAISFSSGKFVDFMNSNIDPTGRWKPILLNKEYFHMFLMVTIYRRRLNKHVISFSDFRELCFCPNVRTKKDIGNFMGLPEEAEQVGIIFEQLNYFYLVLSLSYNWYSQL